MENGKIESVGRFTGIACFVRDGCVEGLSKGAQLQGFPKCAKVVASTLQGVGSVICAAKVS